MRHVHREQKIALRLRVCTGTALQLVTHLAVLAFIAGQTVKEIPFAFVGVCHLLLELFFC